MLGRVVGVNNSKKFIDKMGTSLKALNEVLRVSTEFEGISRVHKDTIASRLNRMGRGLNRSDEGLNEGNGFNNDCHIDGTIRNDSIVDSVTYFPFEISLSPMDVTSFKDIKTELERLVGMLKEATDGMLHTIYASNHIHCSLPYDGYENLFDMNFTHINRYIGLFMTKFMPVIKYFGMTCFKGTRGAGGNSYDLCDSDMLFSWANRVANNGHSSDSDSYLARMERSSYLRVMHQNFRQLHVENRITDQSASPTHLALMMTITRCIVLFGIDFARNGYKFDLTVQDIALSQDLMRQHRMGYRQLDMGALRNSYKEFLSYIVKYLKVSDSLDAIDYMEKLLTCSIPEFLGAKGFGQNYDPCNIEKAFNQRNRTGNEALRNDYLYAIKSMAVKVADDLNEFHKNVASHLTNLGHDGITEKQAKSLYQMFNRENVDITFLGGRLVYMGD